MNSTTAADQPRARVVRAVGVAGLGLSSCASMTQPPTVPPPASSVVSLAGYLDQHASEVAGVGFAELRDGEVVDTLAYGQAITDAETALDQGTVLDRGRSPS